MLSGPNPFSPPTSHGFGFGFANDTEVGALGIASLNSQELTGKILGPERDASKSPELNRRSSEGDIVEIEN